MIIVRKDNVEFKRFKQLKTGDVFSCDTQLHMKVCSSGANAVKLANGCGVRIAAEALVQTVIGKFVVEKAGS